MLIVLLFIIAYMLVLLKMVDIYASNLHLKSARSKDTLDPLLSSSNRFKSLEIILKLKYNKFISFNVNNSESRSKNTLLHFCYLFLLFCCLPANCNNYGNNKFRKLSKLLGILNMWLTLPRITNYFIFR